LRVGQVPVSVEFYRRLGFELVEGDPAEGWAVMSDGTARLGFYEERFMPNDKLSLNFRGGDMRKLAAQLTAAGVTFEHGPRFAGGGGGSASLRDPDGHLVFLDSTQG